MTQRSFYYSDSHYLQLLQSLYFDLTKSEAFVQLMGKARSGKSALCETLSLYMERKGHDVIYIDYPIESPEMLRSVLAQKFNLPSAHNVSRLLEDALAKEPENTKILIFDDAHQLSDITLIEIYRLAEIQVGSRRVLNVLLCGEPELEQRLLSKKEFKSLLLNVSRKYLLTEMDKETLSRFFASYVAEVGKTQLQLESEALDLFARTSKGFPGPAILLSELLVRARANDSAHTVITKPELAAIIKSSDIQQSLPSSDLIDVNQLRVLGPIAVVFTVAALGFLFQIVNGADEESVVDGNEAIAALEATDPEQTATSPFATAEVEPDPDPDPDPESGLVVAEVLEETPVETDVEASSAPPMPSLLRPASVFSLDNEEIPEDDLVTDSSLALVTAAEIGLTPEVINEPEFEVIGDAAAIPSNPIESVTASTSSLIQNAPPIEEASDEGNIQDEIEVDRPAEIASVQEIAIALPVTEQLATSAEVEEPKPIAILVRSRIDDWVQSWESQELPDYFASYHSEFEPRYENSRERWRQSRSRVIGNAEWIRLTLREYETIEESTESVEVHFWLDYESPTYSDSTRKKIVLSKDLDDWLILEEINLQVRS